MENPREAYDVQRFTDSPSDKIGEWFKNNIINLVLIVVCAVFVLKDIADIKKNDNTIDEIIFNSFLSLVMGYTLTALLGKKGLVSGRNSDRVVNANIEYGKSVDKATPNLERLDNFCDYKNEQRLKRALTSILRKTRIKYLDYINGSYDIDKLNDLQKKAIIKADKFKLHLITPDNLLANASESIEKGSSNVSLSKYEAQQNAFTLFTKILCAIIFGLYGLRLAEDWSIANILWGAVQVSVWLIMGASQYFKNYMYVVNVFREDIVRKKAYLDEFNETINKNNLAFIDEKEELNNGSFKTDSQD